MSSPIVRIASGQIKGKIIPNLKNQDIFCFQGIPYGKPPIGNLRFKSPQPAEPWAGVRDATLEGSPCFARIPVVKTFFGSEDCLFLNVYTRSIQKTTNLKPVMFFIHGGGFTSGSGNSELYGPEFLLTEDIVLVTINYRLHVLGFLSLQNPELEVPGNAGLKDIVLALKWVQTNIRVFNGDPQNVTIFGESAGAAASHYLVLSPMAKGLFHKAILQSGSALCLWARSYRCADQVAKQLGLNESNEKKILEHLQQVPIEDLYLAGERIPDKFVANQIRPFAPIVEINSKDSFLSEDPLEIIKSGRYNHVPIMIGYTNREGILSEILQKPKPFKPITDFELAVPYTLQLNPKSDKSIMVQQQIKKFYYGNEEPTTTNKDKFYLMETDNFFVREIIRSVRLHLENLQMPMFLYTMSIDSNLNFLKKLYEIKEPGVSHADDLGYLFKSMFTPDIEKNSVEEIAVLRFVKLWTNFAKCGNPTPDVSCSLLNICWKPTEKNVLHFLDIGTKLTTGVNPEKERMAFWDEMFNVNATNKL